LSRNTRMTFLYRDASNYKYGGEIVVRGRLRFEDLSPFLLHVSEDDFVPEDVGLEHPGGQTESFPGSDDHALCELREDDFEETTVRKCHCTAEELIERFRTAHKASWPGQFKYLEV